jgi:hypothetical protein
VIPFVFPLLASIGDFMFYAVGEGLTLVDRVKSNFFPYPKPEDLFMTVVGKS